MLAFSLFLASLLAVLPHRTAVAGILLSVFCLLTIQRGGVWSSEVALWEDTTQKAPGKARAWFNLGGAYLNGDNERAGVAFQRAIALQPNFPEAFYNLGVIEQGRGNAIAALGYYDRAVRQNQEYWPAWNNLGNMMFSMGQRERAVEYFERVLSLNPDYWPAQYNLAIVHFSNGRFEKALPKLKTVLDWRPDFREARYLFVVSLRNAGYRSAADEEWKKLGESGVAQANLPAMLPSPSRP
jgi:tetratricopeptide (TPR) repeat protein